MNGVTCCDFNDFVKVIADENRSHIMTRLQSMGIRMWDGINRPDNDPHLTTILSIDGHQWISALPSPYWRSSAVPFC